MVLSNHEILENGWKYVPVCRKFRTTGPERWPDGGHKMFRTAIKMMRHHVNNPAQYVLNVSPPTAMDVGNHIFPGVKKDHRLTIGLFYHQARTGKVRYHGVRLQ